LTSLTALDLDSVSYSISDGIAGLSALTGLQRLRLSELEAFAVDEQPLQKSDMNPDGWLPLSWLQPYWQRQEQRQQDVLQCMSMLTQLTHVWLEPDLLLTDAVAPFSCLQQLQELGFHGDSVHSPAVLAELPVSLTKLVVSWGGRQDLSSSTVPCLQRLTAMQHLELDSYAGDLQPSFCSSMQQLRVLSLTGNLSYDAMSVLVAIVPTLTALESLTLSSTRGRVQELLGDDAPKYAALLPLSAHLTHLEVTWSYGFMLDVDCGQHLFAAGRQLPQLKQLLLGAPGAIDDGLHDLEQVADAVGHKYACLCSGDVDGLVECCPGLEQLWIPCILDQGAELESLLRLTALTNLCVGGIEIDDSVAATVLSQMTVLQRLDVYAAEELTDSGLLTLRALTQLTYLMAWDCGVSRAVTGMQHRSGKCLQLTEQVRQEQG
jgi:hypothetical protein